MRLHSSSGMSVGHAHARPPFGDGRHRKRHPPLLIEHALDPAMRGEFRRSYSDFSFIGPFGHVAFGFDFHHN